MRWDSNRIYFVLIFSYTEIGVNEKENAMFGTEIVLALILIRVILPVGLMLLLGEWVRQREIHYWFG
jgi:hypothetical protein